MYREIVIILKYSKLTIIVGAGLAFKRPGFDSRTLVLRTFINSLWTLPYFKRHVKPLVSGLSGRDDLPVPTAKLFFALL